MQDESQEWVVFTIGWSVSYVVWVWVGLGKWRKDVLCRREEVKKWKST